MGCCVVSNIKQSVILLILCCDGLHLVSSGWLNPWLLPPNQTLLLSPRVMTEEGTNPDEQNHDSHSGSPTGTEGSNRFAKILRAIIKSNAVAEAMSIPPI